MSSLGVRASSGSGSLRAPAGVLLSSCGVAGLGVARSRTSFASGNRAAVRHGLKSGSITAQKRAATRAEVSALLTANLPHLEAADMPLVDMACDVISDLRQIRSYLDSRGGIINRKGQPQGCAGLYGSLMRQAVAIFDRLGIGPGARAQLITNLGLAGNPRQSLAAQAHRELLDRYAPKELSE